MTERIDHVVIHVEEQLDDAVEKYARLGFTLTPRGHHSKGTSNHLAIFGDDYLELLGVEAHNFAAKWEHPAGLVGLVFKTSDADHTWRRLVARGVPLDGDGAQAFHRPVVVDGEHLGDAAFRTLRIAADRIPNGRVFFCEHGTPELVWRPDWQSHPNGAKGLAEYVYVAAVPNAAAASLQQFFDASTVTRHEHGIRFQAGTVAVWYLTPEGVARHYGIDLDRIPQGVERAVGLTLRVDSVRATYGVLQANGITDVQMDAGKVVVPSVHTHGVILAFAEA